MPHKVWTVGEEVLAADFQSYLQNQTVPQFPNTAARDTWAAPPKGALCVTTDTNANWQYSGSAWMPLTVGAKGMVAQGTDVGTAFAAAAPGQCGGSFVAEAGRMYRYEATAEFWITVAGTVVSWEIRVNGTALRTFRQSCTIAGGFPVEHVNAIGWSAPGAIPACPFLIVGARVLGTGTCQFTAAPAQVWSWAVYDVGPAVGPTALAAELDPPAKRTRKPTTKGNPE